MVNNNSNNKNNRINMGHNKRDFQYREISFEDLKKYYDLFENKEKTK